MKKKMIRMVTVLLAMTAMLLSLTACGEKAPEVKTKTSSMQEMVAYLESKGYIEKGAKSVNINETTGYLKDNTGGQFTDTAVADEAYDYNGIWIFRWDLENPTEFEATYNDMKANSGVIVLKGGAAVLETAAQNGAFAIAFAPDFANKDAVLKDFEALSE